jgi:hypothetical protein
MHCSNSATRGYDEAVNLDQPDHPFSISEFPRHSTDAHSSLSRASRGASINEATAMPRSNETDRKTSDEAENLIQLEPPKEAALASYTALGIQHHSSISALSVTGSSTSLARPAKPESEHGPTHTRRIYHKWYNSWIDGWTAEILSCSLSAAALLGLMATLRYFEGWVITAMPLKININSLVAVFATTIKASLLLAVAEGKFYVTLMISIF